MKLIYPKAPVETTVLKTAAMLNPGEGLKVNETRGLLVSAYYSTAATKTDTSSTNTVSIKPASHASSRRWYATRLAAVLPLSALSAKTNLSSMVNQFETQHALQLV